MSYLISLQLVFVDYRGSQSSAVARCVANDSAYTVQRHIFRAAHHLGWHAQTELNRATQRRHFLRGEQYAAGRHILGHRVVLTLIREKDQFKVQWKPHSRT